MLKSVRNSALFPVVFFGLLWGLFESTAGYVLHLLPVSIGFLVWYPMAFFFMTWAYRSGGKMHIILLTAVLASGIKFINLLLPGSVDKVINPAFSILFEGLAMFLVLLAFRKTRESFWSYAGMAFGANTLWRLMYAVYILTIVPQWLEKSVLKDGAAILRFFLIDNLASGALVLLVLLIWARMRGGAVFERALQRRSELD